MDINYQRLYPELWGGIECTINRVGDQFRDQLAFSGHYGREGDIEKIASLGVKKLRYPVLWEKHQTSQNEAIDWSWAERQLSAIRDQGIIPIAGLLHHGSGPAFTSLSDPEFPVKFASYADQFVRHFPWVKYYSLINEPLTTARFSGLYGFWYPHFQTEKAFVDMLLNQTKATVLAMNAIKRINPAARFIQTEDLAKTHSSPVLRYQADFENERRWLTNDLLCGFINRDHPQWDHITGLGISSKKLEYFLANPAPPDILGYNYYVTSERYLTEEVAEYPGIFRGGNGQHIYVDIEAARSGHNEGIKVLLKEAWRRYHLPLAVTECHLNCTADEQLRWFYEIWESVTQLKNDGVKIDAVTAWSLLGAFDWDSLLTRMDHHYESGAFTITDNFLSETPLCKLLRRLAAQGYAEDALFSSKGWWHRKKKEIIGNDGLRAS